MGLRSVAAVVVGAALAVATSAQATSSEAFLMKSGSTTRTCELHGQDISRICSDSGCRVVVDNSPESCNRFCDRHGLKCARAWSNMDNQRCDAAKDVNLIDCSTPSAASDLICECQPGWISSRLEQYEAFPFLICQSASGGYEIDGKDARPTTYKFTEEQCAKRCDEDKDCTAFTRMAGSEQFGVSEGEGVVCFRLSHIDLPLCQANDKVEENFTTFVKRRAIEKRRAM